MFTQPEESENDLCSCRNENVSEEDFLRIIKTGDELKEAGKVIEAHEKYQTALRIATILDNKIFMINVLCSKAGLHILKGEVKIAADYVDKANDLLKAVDYTEGILKTSLLKMQLCYAAHEYYKVREIGTEAIKLCRDEHAFYKGRILLTLAEVFSEMTEIDEHLNILQQALECFQSADNLRGTIITLNNIAGVYADKAQDNEKALEYYFMLKEKSEEEDNSSSLLTSLLAYINIGEVLKKLLKYREASIYLNEGLEKAKTSKYKSCIFYAYCQLIEVCVKLGNYQEAFSYYKLAEAELKNFPEQGEWSVHYYRSVSLLMLEFGRNDDSKNYIKKALEIIGNVNSLVNWTIGYVYELVKLRLAKNDTDLTNGLEAVKFILSQYKDSELLLDKAYDYAIELIHLGQASYSLEFLDNYKNLQCKSEVLQLKQLYIKLLTLSAGNSDKSELLAQAIDASADTSDKKLQYGIYICAACYFDNIGDLSRTAAYHNMAADVFANLVSVVPDDYKPSFSAQFKNQRITIEKLFSL